MDTPASPQADTPERPVLVPPVAGWACCHCGTTGLTGEGDTCPHCDGTGHT
ncbi:hypothetical protein GCM10023085_33110 [Actinomadura viridis]|uniref:Rubrerythrin n=1 Tax=Actinomadura viridis TaxID=58110 RepID=A0A931GH32_9ACTN|nr:rubrerythrin [Actinomadura viridis]